jgi:hypothetical protein
MQTATKLKIYNWLNKHFGVRFRKLEASLAKELFIIAQAKEYAKGNALREQFHYRKLKGLIRSVVRPEPCRHLKGAVSSAVVVNGVTFIGKGMPGGFPRKDYSVYLHTFPDGHPEIRCTICGKKWFKDSQDWKEALKMCEESTNRSSSSEIVLNGETKWT